jgi:hypothetical protein
MKIIREQKDFNPVVIKIETIEEWGALDHALWLASQQAYDPTAGNMYRALQTFKAAR